MEHGSDREADTRPAPGTSRTTEVSQASGAYGTGRRGSGGVLGSARRLTGETKHAFKTTEFWVYLTILFGLLIAGVVADADEGSQVDGFGANQVWLYAVILTVGYLLSRGLAKSGTQDPYSDQPPGGGEAEASIGDRVKAAAQVLKEGPDPERSSGQGGTPGETPRY